MSRVFANGLGDQGSISGRVIPKTQKMVRDATLLNTQHYKLRIKGKVEQSKERSSALPYTLLGVVAPSPTLAWCSSALPYTLLGVIVSSPTPCLV